MKLKDKEGYVVSGKLLDSAFKGTYETERTIISEDVLTGDIVEKTGDILYKIMLQINGRPHDLFYDDEEIRDDDFNLIAEAIEKRG